MLQFKLAAVLIAAILSSSAVADITGTYLIAFGGLPIEAPENVEITLTIRVDDEGKYSGTWKDPQGTVEIEEIEIDESKFSFSYERETPWGELEISFEGEIENGKISGKMIDPKFGEDEAVEFTGKIKEEETLPEESDTET